MEYLDLYNEKKEKTGKTIVRGEQIPVGLYKMISVIFIENNNNEFLFQFTSKEKGHVWAVPGGHVKSGDNAEETIIKEVEEEMGYTLDKDKLKHIHTFMKNSIIAEVYYIKEDIDLNALILQEEEVESVKWLTHEEIDKLTNEGLVRLLNVLIMNELKLF